MKPVAQGVERVDQEPVPGLRCPDCDGGLLVGAVRDAFTLLCACGRQLNVPEIAGSEGGMDALEAVLRDWESRLDALRDLSARARLDGFEAISEVFDHRIRRFEARIEPLRKTVRS